jgi:cystathionine beta-lyase/cystathionine gamma-synthase
MRYNARHCSRALSGCQRFEAEIRSCLEDSVPRPNRPNRPVRGERTRAVHGTEARTPGPLSTPIVHSSVFAFPSLQALDGEQARGAASSYYHRVGHPTVYACERRLAAIEGAEDALLFSSGMAAIASVWLSSLTAGDHVVMLRQGYGGTRDLLQWGGERLGWSFDLVDASDPASWAAALRPNTRIFHVETPTNPTVQIVDLTAASECAHRRGATLVVDGTVGSPVGQHPLEHGADFVVHSATKSIGGHADLLAGVVMGGAERLREVWNYRKIFGPMPGPEVAWQIERSLKTLPLRVEASNANALELATRLVEHPGVARVFYPGLPSHPGHEVARRQMLRGFGPLLSFDVRGGAEAAEATVNALQLIRLAPSLGGAETLATVPAHTSHVHLDAAERAKAGIPDGLVRLSAGIEDVDDLWTDLDQALARAAVLRV